METYDLHGYKLEEAINFVEKVIGEVRLKNEERVVKFITGHGVIRKELKKYFDNNDIEYFVDWASEAVLIVTID